MRTSKGLGIDCPHCGHRANQRRTKKQSQLTREKVYRCSNEDCNFVFATLEEIVRTVTPSANPNPDVNLPMSARAQWCESQRNRKAG
ncbi:ogr/Delta-like zinc finger family protein [Pseudoalteromonas sp. R3]|uniref:ogr/Delta-like zinc finger family protein n=1 Tax=Pseudoalteromonas sp. R3 TaxID=1709477 RepID=UPI0006B6367F|nr:ogr/Delta-like zinc finger family protein [Pseudoalteromonas sp. R3]AZZ97989.1 transcriptional regulator [Pseudoalteromonas sp. R3]